MQVPWTQYRFTPPSYIPEGRFWAAKTRIGAHRVIVIDELRQILVRSFKGVAWVFVFTIIPLAVALIIQDSELKTSGTAQFIMQLAWVLVIGFALSLILTVGSLIVCVFQYWYHGERVIAVAAISESYDEFLEEALDRGLLA